MKKNMTKQTKRWFCIVAVLLAVIIALGITLGVATKWGKDLDNLKPGNDTANQTGGGMEPDESGESHGIALSFTEIAREQFGDYGISPAAETAQSVTAKITPEDAENSTLKWTLSWENGTSGKFGYQKDVSDYVTGSASQDTHTYNLQCSQAFGEVIILKVTAEGDESVFATRKIQYRQGSFSGIQVTFSGVTAGGWRDGFTPANLKPTVDFPIEDEAGLEESFLFNIIAGFADATYTLGADITNQKAEISMETLYLKALRVGDPTLNAEKGQETVTVENWNFSRCWKDVLFLADKKETFNFTAFKANIKKVVDSTSGNFSSAPMLKFKFSATINGAEQSTTYNIAFTDQGFGNLAPTSIGWSDDGSDIVFGG